MKYESIKRAWLISDLHFGVHSSNVEWLEIQKDYFYKFFIPLVEREKQEGDALFILGDVFENRQTVNILVMNEVYTLFKKLASILPVTILIGNHDCYKKHSTDTHSSIMFSNIDNIDVIDEMKEVNASGKKLLFVPWVEDKKEMQEILKSNSGDYLFVHDDFSGMKSNSKTVVPGGLPYAVVNKYGSVYSGHIHYGQKIKNVTMLGNPYQTSRSDIDNEKRVYLIDIVNGKETYFVNDFSPKFLRLDYSEIEEMGKEKAKMLVENNFVDILISQEDSMKDDVKDFVEELNESRKLELVPKAVEEEIEDVDISASVGKSIPELIDDYVDKLSYDERIKDKLKQVAKKLFIKATNEN